MKKWLSILLAAVMTSALMVGCSGKTGDESSSTIGTVEETTGIGSTSTTASDTTTAVSTTQAAVTTKAPATTTKAPATTTKPAAVSFDTNLKNWTPGYGTWIATANGYQIVAEARKEYYAVSDTTVASGKAFTYEADVTVSDDYTTSQFSLLFGIKNPSALYDGTYYELRVGLKDKFSRFFSSTNREITRYGEVKALTTQQLSAAKFHIKFDVDASNQATYYINNEKIATVELKGYAGGNFGVMTYNTGAVFNHVKLTVK